MKQEGVQQRRVVLTVALGLIWLGTGAAYAAQSGWFYTLGVEKQSQQAQFCAAESDVRALADLFRKKGARAGYFAIEQIYDCNIRSATFTPVETLDSVAMQTKSGSYFINFVKVRLRDGATSYLVTTRDVKGP